MHHLDFFSIFSKCDRQQLSHFLFCPWYNTFSVYSLGLTALNVCQSPVCEILRLGSTFFTCPPTRVYLVTNIELNWTEMLRTYYQACRQPQWGRGKHSRGAPLVKKFWKFYSSRATFLTLRRGVCEISVILSTDRPTTDLCSW